MPYIHYPLPEYPAQTDVWEKLKNESRPLVVYGMGNGADKLFERFALYGINVSDVFASDGFVRGHSFRGYRVKSFSEIKESYPDFVIVLSFASNREDVLTMLAELNSQYDMYVPDMPVAGIDEYFDRKFYNIHYEEIVRAYEALADESSRAVFSSVINYKLTGRMEYLLSVFSLKEELYGLMPREDICLIVDAGAYNGDTAREAKAYFPKLKKVYALEPDKRNYNKLYKYSQAENEVEVIPINVAAWCDEGDGRFFGSGNRNSTAVATASFEHSEDAVRMIKIDCLTEERIDYIKYDVEGAEREALIGSQETILRYMPTLLVSLYHRSRDIFEIINTIRDRYPDYSLYLRRLKCLPAWEIDLICVKK